MKVSPAVLSLSILAIITLSSLSVPLLSVQATSTGPLNGINVNGEYTGAGYGAYQSNYTVSSGNYAFSKIYTAGSYLVSASGDGFIDSPGLMTSVTLGHATTGVNINLDRSSIVTGMITGPTGAPIVGASVQLINSTSGADVGSSDTTTSDGRYAIETNVPAGTYNETVTPPAESFFLLFINCFQYSNICPVLPTYVPGFMTKTVTGVTVGAQASVTSNVQLAPSAAIKGRVTFNGAGVAGVAVSVNATCFNCTATTNATGYYVIANDLPSGEYNVSLSTGIYPPLSKPVIVSGSAVVHATAGLVTTQNFALTASAKVSGYVKDTHGNPVGGAEVEIGNNFFGILLCGGGFLPCATNTTDTSGHYELNTNIGTGMFNITASKYGYKGGSLTSLLSVVAGNTYVANDITLTANTVVTPAHITGTVKDSHGNPIQGAEVHGRGVAHHVQNSTLTDASGNFNLEMYLGVADTVNLTASHDTYTSNSIVTSSVTPGSTHPAGTIVLTSITPGSISGTITGQLIPGLIQPTRTEKWDVMSGGLIVTKTDSELSYGILDLFLVGNSITAYVQGPDGTTGSFAIQIPKSVLAPTSGWTVTDDGNVVANTPVVNSTYTVITISYSHTSHTLVFTANGVVPEFPTAALPFVLLIATATSVILVRVARRKKVTYAGQPSSSPLSSS